MSSHYLVTSSASSADDDDNDVTMAAKTTEKYVFTKTWCKAELAAAMVI